MRMFATPAAAAWLVSDACILLLLSRNSFPLADCHPLTLLHVALPLPVFGSIPFETLTHRAGFFQGNGKIPHPSSQFQPPKAPNGMTSSSLAAKVPFAFAPALAVSCWNSVKSVTRGCSFHAPRSGQQIVSSLANVFTLCAKIEMRESGWSLSCPIWVGFGEQERIGGQYLISVK